jgi:hypothetical protein
VSHSEGKSDGAEEERCRHPCAGFIGQGEVGDDAGGEQHREPEEPTVLLSFEGAGCCPEGRRKKSLPAPRIGAALTSPFRIAQVRHGRGIRNPGSGGLRPALTPHLALCYITTAFTP